MEKLILRHQHPKHRIFCPKQNRTQIKNSKREREKRTSSHHQLWFDLAASIDVVKKKKKKKEGV